MNKTQSIEDQVRDILQAVFTGKEHLGEVYVTEATLEILSIFKRYRLQLLDESEKRAVGQDESIEDLSYLYFTNAVIRNEFRQQQRKIFGEMRKEG